MQRGRIFVVLFVIVAVAVVGVSQFFRSQPPFVLRIAVSPLALSRVTDAAARFTSEENLSTGNRRISIAVEPVEDVDLWTGAVRWTAEDHPHGWIAAARWSVEYAESRLPLQIVTPTTARTGLAWGAFSDRAAALTGDGARVLDWPDVNRIAAAGRWSALGVGDPGWGNFVFAMRRPNRTIDGLAVVFSAAAAHAGAADITSALTDPAFRAAFEHVVLSVPNFNTLGIAPAAAIAGRNASVGEVGLLPESEWLANLRGELVRADNPIALTYPAYTVTFDFPLARWSDSTLTAEHTDALAQFGAFLLTDDEQAAAMASGLRPVSGEAIAPTFSAAAGYGVRVPLPTVTEIVPPTLNTVQGVLTWLNGAVR